MDLPLGAAVAVGLAIATRALSRVYLERLDRKEGSGTAEERAAIAASRRRGQGHLWVGGAIAVAIALTIVFFGVSRPAPAIQLVLSVLLVAAALFAGSMASRAYRDARAIRGA